MVGNQCSLPVSAQCPRGPCGQGRPAPDGEASTTEKKHGPEKATVRACHQVLQRHPARAPVVQSEGLEPPVWLEKLRSVNPVWHLGYMSAEDRACSGRRQHASCVWTHF